MKDFNSNELHIGDKVIFIAKNNNAHNLKRGTVDRFESNIGQLCVIKTGGNFEYKIKDTKSKVIKL